MRFSGNVNELKSKAKGALIIKCICLSMYFIPYLDPGGILFF